MGARPSDVMAEMEAIEGAARAGLEAAGMDIAALIAEAEAFDRMLAVYNATLVDALDGRDVEIPGYALPLEYAGTEISEFLLVPYVGACIHVPPPPPNQIVHVRFPEGFQSAGLFTPGAGRGPHLGGPFEPFALVRGRQRRHRRRATASTPPRSRSTTIRARPSFCGRATGRDRGPPLLRRPRGGAGRRPAAVSDKGPERFRLRRKGSGIQSRIVMPSASERR